jgi:hypothetical protein
LPILANAVSAREAVECVDYMGFRMIKVRKEGTGAGKNNGRGQTLLEGGKAVLTDTQA